MLHTQDIVRAACACALDISSPALLAATTQNVLDGIKLLPTFQRSGFLGVLEMFDCAARINFARPFRKLEKSQAAEHLHAWQHGNLLQRQFTRALLSLAKFAYYEQPEVMAAIGYTPHAWIDKVKKRRLTTYEADIESKRAVVLAPDPLGASHD